MIEIENQKGANSKQQQHEGSPPANGEYAPECCKVSVTAYQIWVAANLNGAVEPFNTVMEKKSDGQGKEEHGKCGNANGFPEGQEVSAPPNAPSNYENDERKENSTQTEVFVHEKPGNMRPHFSHPVGIGLILVQLIVVLLKYQTLIMSPIE